MPGKAKKRNPAMSEDRCCNIKTPTKRVKGPQVTFENAMKCLKFSDLKENIVIELDGLPK